MNIVQSLKSLTSSFLNPSLVPSVSHRKQLQKPSQLSPKINPNSPTVALVLKPTLHPIIQSNPYNWCICARSYEKETHETHMQLRFDACPNPMPLLPKVSLNFSETSLFSTQICLHLAPETFGWFKMCFGYSP